MKQHLKPITVLFSIFLFVVMSHMACGPAPAKDPKTMKVDWAGHPLVSDNHPTTPRTGWIGTHQIGFREDGVVVWRLADRPVVPVTPVPTPPPPAAVTPPSSNATPSAPAAVIPGTPTPARERIGK